MGTIKRLALIAICTLLVAAPSTLLVLGVAQFDASFAEAQNGGK